MSKDDQTKRMMTDEEAEIAFDRMEDLPRYEPVSNRTIEWLIKLAAKLEDKDK